MGGRVWVRSAGWDAFFMMAGLWSMVFVVALQGSIHLTRFHFVLGVLFWIGHRLSTAYVAFCQQAYRQLLVEQNTRFIRVPLVICVVVFLVLLVPESIIPIPFLYRLLLIAVVDFVWEFYHFTMQQYGVVSVYRMLARQDPGAIEAKRIEKLYCLTVFGGAIPAAVVYHAANGWAQSHPDFFVPMWALQVLRFAIIAFALGFTGRMLFKEFSNPKASLPKALYIVSIGVPVALTVIYDSMAPGLLILAIQHWLVAVGLSVHLASGTAPSTGTPNLWYRFWGFFNRKWWAVLALMCLFSAAVGPIMEFSDVERRWAVKAFRGLFSNQASERSYVYWGETYMNWLSAIDQNMLLMIFVAAGFSFGWVHFLMDRAIYRFSNADTRRQTLPLLIQRG